jgi:hypothetical protein
MKVSRNGKIIGDYSHQEILDLLAKGELLLTDHFWGEGMTDWLPLSQLPKTVNSSNSNPPSLPKKPITPNKDNKIVGSGCILTFCAILGVIFFIFGLLDYFNIFVIEVSSLEARFYKGLKEIRDLLLMILGFLLFQFYYNNKGK